ncbi:MAG: Yip1 family protein [Brevirhabdus sp.]
MSLTGDIMESWRAPSRVMRRHLSHGPQEARALTFLLIACFLFFVAQTPDLSRQAHLNPSGDGMMAMASARFWGAVLLAPLFFYALAGLSHILARFLGGRGSYYGARLALFWSLLVVAPLILARGLLVGFLGMGPVAGATGLIIGLAFVFYWMSALRVAEQGGEQ